jgi:hypothetical protein
MSPALIDALRDREPALLGQTVVVIGGSAGIGFETARRARAEGANIILTGRTAERLQQAASELGALSTAAFDANDPALLESFFRDLPAPIDHVMLTGPGPRYWALQEIEFEQARLATGWPRPSSRFCCPAAASTRPSLKLDLVECPIRVFSNDRQGRSPIP